MCSTSHRHTAQYSRCAAHHTGTQLRTADVQHIIPAHSSVQQMWHNVLHACSSQTYTVHNIQRRVSGTAHHTGTQLRTADVQHIIPAHSSVQQMCSTSHRHTAQYSRCRHIILAHSSAQQMWNNVLRACSSQTYTVHNIQCRVSGIAHHTGTQLRTADVQHIILAHSSAQQMWNNVLHTCGSQTYTVHSVLCRVSDIAHHTGTQLRTADVEQCTAGL